MLRRNYANMTLLSLALWIVQRRELAGCVVSNVLYNRTCLRSRGYLCLRRQHLPLRGPTVGCSLLRRCPRPGRCWYSSVLRSFPREESFFGYLSVFVSLFRGRSKKEKTSGRRSERRGRHRCATFFNNLFTFVAASDSRSFRTLLLVLSSLPCS